MEAKLKPVTVEDQERMGLLRNTGGPKLVPAIVERPKAQVAPCANDMITVNVTPTATSHIDMRTSAQDRAVGFLIASMPRTFAFSLAVAVAGIVLAGWSLAVSLVVLFGLFSVVELASYFYTLAVSAEGVAFYEAKQKWPGERLYTYVDPTRIKSANPGYCYKKAGWRTCGTTKSGKIILEIQP